MVIIDDFTSKSDIYFLENQGQVYDAILDYMIKSETTTANTLDPIRLDGAREHKEDIKTVLEKIEGV